MKVGNRIYHASCYAEATKDRERGGTPMPRTGTPDSVLGKRKAEVRQAAKLFCSDPEYRAD